MKPIVLQDIRSLQTLKTPSRPDDGCVLGFAWGPRHATPATCLREEPRRVKHPPLRFDKGVAVDRFA
ncbi:MAG: hypothetical protein EBR42_00525 [Betaproteobacteria bacterium]|jgi:hypothetical protein|nr:hypothetical protein [Betaproteobacteria bacterium]